MMSIFTRSNYCLSCIYLFICIQACMLHCVQHRILSLWPGVVASHPTAVKAGSCHWTAREFPVFIFIFQLYGGESESVRCPVVSSDLTATPIDCSPPGSSYPRDPQANLQTGYHSLLQSIFPIQGSKLNLLCCRLRFFTVSPRKPLLVKLKNPCLLVLKVILWYM